MQYTAVGEDVVVLMLITLSVVCFGFQVSYWRQFEHGLMGRSAVRRLLELTETKADKHGCYITLTDIKASWKMKGIYRLFPQIVSIRHYL